MDHLFGLAKIYGQILSLSLPFYMLQVMFQTFFVTAEKPALGFIITLLSGMTNMVLDFVFVGLMNGGVFGAAWATLIGTVIGSVIPLIYFAKKRTSPLYLVKTSWNSRDISRTCSNGFSELLTNVSMSLVGILYNWQLIRYIGENGVSAYGLLMYVTMIFAAAFMGFSLGTAPILSYQYGAGDTEELKRLLKMSLWIIGAFSIGMFFAARVLAAPLSHIYVGYDQGLFAITLHAFDTYSWGFLFRGVAMYGSGFFTALNDGLDSALISIFRTLFFQVAAVLVLPMMMGVEGIWWSIVLAEAAAFVLVFVFLKLRQKRFGY